MKSRLADDVAEPHLYCRARAAAIHQVVNGADAGAGMRHSLQPARFNDGLFCLTILP